MRFPLDVAWCDPGGTVLRVANLGPGRCSRLVVRARFVVEAPAGAARRWGLVPGARVRLRARPPSGADREREQP